MNCTDSSEGQRAVADHHRHQYRRDLDSPRRRHRHRRHQRRAGDVARPDTRYGQSQQKEHQRNQAGAAAAEFDTVMCDPFQRPIGLSLREEQRDADQHQKRLRREAIHDVGELHAAEVHAENPCQRQAEHTDVQLTEAADDHRDHESAE